MTAYRSLRCKQIRTFTLVKKDVSDGVRFAGFEDVGDSIQPDSDSNHRDGEASRKKTTTGHVQPERDSVEPDKSRAGENQKKLGSEFGIFFAIVLVIIVVAIIADQASDSGRKVNSQPIQVSLPSKESKATISSTEGAAQVAIPVAILPSEKKPQKNLLRTATIAEVRYCAYEGQRLEKLQGLLGFEALYDAFNKRIDDFNARCPSLSGYNSDWEKANLEAGQKFSSTLEYQAQQIYGGWKLEILRPLVLELQIQFARLGYDVGAADGLYGPRTKNVIEQLEQLVGVEQTGQPSIEMLNYLKQQPSEIQAGGSLADRQHSNSIGSSRELTSTETRSIESACILARSQGAASYNACLNRQVDAAKRGPRAPSMAGLSNAETRSIESACILARSQGAASYNACLNRQVDAAKRGPRAPSMAGLSNAEIRSIESACILARSQGAATYNACLNRQVGALR